MVDTSGGFTCVLGHTIVPDLSADRSGLCSMLVEMAKIATKPSSHDDGLVAILAISACYADRHRSIMGLVAMNCEILF